MTLIVNFFCGAGGGKSTLSTGVFSELKWMGWNKCRICSRIRKTSFI